MPVLYTFKNLASIADHYSALAVARRESIEKAARKTDRDQFLGEAVAYEAVAYLLRNTRLEVGDPSDPDFLHNDLMTPFGHNQP